MFARRQQAAFYVNKTYIISTKGMPNSYAPQSVSKNANAWILTSQAPLYLKH